MKEEMAWQVAEMFVKEVTSVTMAEDREPGPGLGRSHSENFSMTDLSLSLDLDCLCNLSRQLSVHSPSTACCDI